MQSGGEARWEGWDWEKGGCWDLSERVREEWSEVGDLAWMVNRPLPYF